MLSTSHKRPDGSIINNIDLYGGGVTSSMRNDTSKIFVTVSPNGNPKLEVIKKGEIKTVNESPAEILIHELIGHAVPIAESWNGNAVQKENIVRKQAKLWLRKAEENHVCY